MKKSMCYLAISQIYNVLERELKREKQLLTDEKNAKESSISDYAEFYENEIEMHKFKIKIIEELIENVSQIKVE